MASPTRWHSSPLVLGPSQESGARHSEVARQRAVSLRLTPYVLVRPRKKKKAQLPPGLSLSPYARILGVCIAPLLIGSSM